jgi:Amt family ammonium transporter
MLPSVREKFFGLVGYIRLYEEDLFILHVQPIIPLNTREFSVAHYELLLRLTDDDQTPIYQDAFLPAAARYGLLPAIDHWVFAKAIGWLSKNR